MKVFFYSLVLGILWGSVSCSALFAQATDELPFGGFNAKGLPSKGGAVHDRANCVVCNPAFSKTAPATNAAVVQVLDSLPVTATVLSPLRLEDATPVDTGDAGAVGYRKFYVLAQFKAQARSLGANALSGFHCTLDSASRKLVFTATAAFIATGK